MERLELCCHTNMSKLQGIDFVEDYIDEAVKRGYKQIAITDTDSTQSFYRAEYYIKNNKKLNDFKIIYGAEMHFKTSKDDNRIYTIYIYVKNQKGLKNLYKLVSKAYENIVDDTPLLYKDDLTKYREGLLYASIGNKSEVYQSIESSYMNDIISYYDFIGIEPNESKKGINIKINKICKAQNKLLIGTSECNFINKEDYICNEVLNFYKKSSNIENGNNKYFQTTEELMNQFFYLKNAKEIVADNTIKIADSIDQIAIYLPRNIVPQIDNAQKIIYEKCVKKAIELYGHNMPRKITDRLELEIQSIIANKVESIYLITSDLADYSNNLGHKVGSRGSVGNSFVAYLLGITNINPLDYNLPFEMFAGKNYDREPDIDLYFSKEMQLKNFEDLEIEYGRDKVIWEGTVVTLDESTIRQCCNEFKNEFGLDNSFDVESISNKIRKIKRCTGEYPSGFFLLPQNIEILDICPTEIGERNHLITHCDHLSIDTPGSYRFDIIGDDAITMIDELEKETNIDSNNIKLDDDEILKMFLHANDNSYPFSTNGIPVFETDYAKKMIEVVKPNNFNDLVCISALYYGTDTWKYNADLLIKDEQKKVDEVISNREDMYNFLVNNGIEKDTAYDIVEFVRKGYANESRRLWIKDKERYWDLYKKWKEYVEILKKHKIPDWYIDSAAKIKYLFPKSHAIENTMNALKIAWYKIHYPKAFYKIYFKRYPDFNVKEYYCKRQVETELNRIKDEEEIAKAKDYKKYSYPYENKKAVDLELVLEMFDRGILKEKEKIKDDYNLINSRAIGDYCRRIKYRLNTEELAVLVHRNKRMSIEEKIEKYYDLIKNYPDMEVIERINCEHYDSVKTLIKKEIKRLKKLSEELMQEEPDCIWVWNECGYDYGLNDIFNTYQATIKDLKQYKDDMKAFCITKKYLNKRKADIHAEYIIENQKIKLINITQFNNSLEDIDSIFVYLPTPFKKGDILINRRKSTRNIDEKGDIFVLDELYTWKNNIKQRLAKGNCDSSDMLAYGYYMSDYDGMEVTLDDIWEYDSFEYYDEELTGRDRFLKTISSLLKGEISIELFLYAYKLIDKDCSVHVTEWYSEEGKRLAGIDKIVK